MKKRLDVLLIAAPSPNPIMMYAMEIQGMPPLGLGYLATYLKTDNYTVKIVDLGLANTTIEAVLSVVTNEKPSVIGISCTTETYTVAVQVAKIIKNTHKECAVVLGGPHVSFEYKSALAHSSVDYVVLNEGENSFKKLCDYCVHGVGTLEKLKGIAYKRDGVVLCAEPEPFIADLDVLPFPDRNLFEKIND